MGKPLDECSREELVGIIKSQKETISRTKKFGLVWEDKPEKVATDCARKLPVIKEVANRAINEAENDKPTNIIIEGDNYHALSVLNYTHAGKIDVIYIDPPYNTGDSKWKYNNNYIDGNDEYRHSKWLSMMEKRLILAKKLLKPEGSLIVAIDKVEQPRLELLLEGLFPGHEIHCVTIVHNPRGTQGKNFSYTHEYALFVLPVLPKESSVVGLKKIADEDVKWSQLRNWGGESLRTDARNCFYPIIIKNDGSIVGFGEVLRDNEHPAANVMNDDGTISVYPIDRQGVERKWRYARQTVEGISNMLRAKKNGGVWQIEIGKNFGNYKTVWQDSKYDANLYGTMLINRIVPNNDFDFPKSLWNTYDCLYAIVSQNKNAVVLDYFAGSGTTGHAVLELNRDGGRRQFILCTNNEVGENLEKSFMKDHGLEDRDVQKWPKDTYDDWIKYQEKHGIASSITYPRIKGVINGYDNVQGLPANVRYFKTGFVERNTTIDKLRRELSPACEDMIRVREGAYEKIIDDDMLKVFKNSRGLTAIIYDRFELAKYIEKIETLNTDAPVHLYVFSYSKSNRKDEMPDSLRHIYEAQPIPEGVLEIYKKIFANIKGGRDA